MGRSIMFRSAMKFLFHRPVLFIRRSVRRKLLFSFFLVTVLTVTGIVWNYYTQTSRDMKRNAIASMERLNEQSTKTMESYMNNIRTESWHYFEDTEMQEFVTEMLTEPEKYGYYLSRFKRFVTENAIVSHMMLDDLQGNVLAAHSGKHYNNIQEIDYWDAERRRLHDLAIQYNGKGMWVGSKAFDSKTGEELNTIAFIQALKWTNRLPADQDIIGVLMIQLDVDEIQSWLKGSTDNAQGHFYIVNRSSGDIEFAEDRSEAGKPILERVQSQHPFKQTNNKHFFIQDRGEQWLVVFKELPKTDWLLVGKVPLDQLLGNVNALAKRSLLIGLFSLLASMLLANLLASRVTVPLIRLRSRMKQMESGKYDVSVPIETVDEIGYLSKSFNRMAQEINGLIVKVYEAELLKKDAEIKVLQSQINPHFLYNTLGTIDSLSSGYEDSRVSTISQSLARMFRYNISGGDMSTLRAEIEQIKMYLYIQKIRYDARLNYRIDIEPGLEPIKLPKLLFQPLVENSIVHGIENEPKGGEVRIQAASIDEGDVEIKVWNNGRPIEPERLREVRAMLSEEPGATVGSSSHPYASIGLLNIQSRLKLVYGASYGIELNSDDRNGTEFVITVKKLS